MIKDIDLSKDQIEELYWTNSNREFARILGIQTGEVTALVCLHGIETKGNLLHGPQATEDELESRRIRIINKIKDRNILTPIDEFHEVLMNLNRGRITVSGAYDSYKQKLKKARNVEECESIRLLQSIVILAIKGLEEILEIADNAYVLDKTHEILKKLKNDKNRFN